MKDGNKTEIYVKDVDFHLKTLKQMNKRNFQLESATGNKKQVAFLRGSQHL